MVSVGNTFQQSCHQLSTLETTLDFEAIFSVVSEF